MQCSNTEVTCSIDLFTFLFDFMDFGDVLLISQCRLEIILVFTLSLMFICSSQK